MDLIINKVYEIYDGTDLMEVYFNDKKYFINKKGEQQRFITLFKYYPPYNDNQLIDAITTYINESNFNIENLIVYSATVAQLGNSKEKFSDYTTEDFYEKNVKILDVNYNEYVSEFRKKPENQKGYVLINRYGNYYCGNKKYSKNLSDAKLDTKDNLSWVMEFDKQYSERMQGYDMYRTGIVSYDRMKYLEETYRSKSNAYFANVFNKCCKYRYLRCWK